MLNALRKSAQGIVAKCILFLLVGSFVFWGIGDIFNKSSVGNTAATVGNANITTQEFRTELGRKQEEWRQKLGKQYSPELIRRLGLNEQVLYNLVNHAVFEQGAKSIGVEVSDAALANAVSKMGVFQDDSGHFSKNRYLGLLQRNGITEKRFLSDIRKELSSKLLIETLQSPPVISAEWVNAVYRAREEQRVASVQLIDASSIAPVAAPTEKEIASWYNEHHAQFQTSEYRAISYLTISAADVAAHNEVSNEDALHVYEERKQELSHPEQRIVEQMLFEREEDAKAASAKLQQGQHFGDVVTSAKLMNKDTVLLGKVTKAELPSETADAVFALAKDGISAPISSGFGWHIVHVKEIIPASVTPFEQAKAEIVKELSAKQSQDVMSKLVTTLEDTIASGASFAAAAEKIGQKVKTIGPVSQTGLLQTGAKAALPSIDNFLATAFITNEREASKPQQLDDGSYVVLFVDSIVPKTTRPLSEVKQVVLANMLAEKKNAKVRQLADDIAKALQASAAPFNDVLAKYNLAGKPVSTSFKRTTDVIAKGGLAGTAVPAELVQEIFTRKRNEKTRAYPLQNGSFVIASVTDIVPPPALNLANETDKKTFKTLEQSLQQEVLDEVIHYTLVRLKSTLGVSINASALHSQLDDRPE